MRGFIDQIDDALPLIMSGKIKLPDLKKFPTPGLMISIDTKINLKQNNFYVSRGGEKLSNAIKYFDLSMLDLICMDVGASTGGFTDCLLKKGASKVYSIDVGRGQLHNRLSKDNRVISMERTNARKKFFLPEKVDLIVIDVSFISLKLILPSVIEHLKSNSNILVLYKPQFELSKEEIPRRGVIKNYISIAEGLGLFINWCLLNKINVKGVANSNLRGRLGNKEIFVLLNN